MRNTAGLAVVFILILLFTACKKEYSYEGGTAEFTLLGLNGHCFNPIVSGNYTTGSALNSSNTVQLQVQVTIAGRFSLQTNSMNGIQFTATGSIADTGVQLLTLTGTGRPASDGIFSFSPEINPSCSFNIEVKGEQVQQADYSLTGAPNSCSNALTLGTYQAGKSLTSANTMVLNVNVTTPGDYVIFTDTLDGISFSGSGHFTRAGNQTVTLAGSGTPLLPQNLQFTISGNGATCTVPLSIDISGNPATYVIQSGQNLCVGNISGSYTAGTPLNSANTYTLLVYVAAIGNYAISTQTVDGVTFYATGEFTTLGDQNVTLTASGTPASVGNFTMTPEIVGPSPLGGKACDFTMGVK